MSDTDSTTPRSPWTRTGFILSAAFLGLVLIAAITLLIKPAASAPAAAPVASQTVPASSPSPAATVAGSGCPSLASESLQRGSALNDAPAGTDWEVTKYASLPSIAGQGPAVVDPDGYRHCYSHSLTGAALAAANFYGQVMDPKVWETAVRKGTVIRPETEDQIDQMKSHGGPTVSDQPITVVGLTEVRATSDKTAEVGLVVVYNGVSMGATLQMEWSGTDWLAASAPSMSQMTDDYMVWGN